MGVLPKLVDEEGKPIGKKYTILPLDEEVFDINANTRAINVPNSFKNNGISVQGDQIAEIVYFRIDRFFDATDLNEMDIYVQWEAPNGDRGVSKEWVRDIESEPGKIIFGWPLSLDITQAHGTVKFSVRFYKIGVNDKNEPVITYSFSTLTASATIKPALDFSLLGDLHVVDNSHLIAQRFTNSQVVGGQRAEVPLYFVNLENKEYDLAENGKYTFAVHAYSTDGGLISYEWYEGNGQNAAEQNETVSLVSSVEYRVTNDTVVTDGKVYYKWDNQSGEYVPFADLITPEMLDKEDPNYANLYEKFSVCIVDKVGQYYAKATNRLSFNTASANSVTGVIPGPKAPTTSDIWLDEDDNKETIRSIIIDPNANTKEFLIGVDAEISDNGVLSYQWKKHEDKSDVWVNIPSANENMYIVNSIGNYSVDVVNTRNKEVLTVNPSNVCRVTYPATIPVLSGLSDNYRVNEAIVVGFNNITCERADSYRYEWSEDFADDSKDGVVLSEENAFIPAHAGNYVLKVYSVYNGDVSAPAEKTFFVGN